VLSELSDRRPTLQRAVRVGKGTSGTECCTHHREAPCFHIASAACAGCEFLLRFLSLYIYTALYRYIVSTGALCGSLDLFCKGLLGCPLLQHMEIGLARDFLQRRTNFHQNLYFISPQQSLLEQLP
jgi:hypothetical protein